MSHPRKQAHDFLNFAATVWIGGNGPLDVEGFRSHASPVMKAYQYFLRGRQGDRPGQGRDDGLRPQRHTTSLCSPRAAGSFRVAAAGLAGTPLLGVLLATDGYGNAQVAPAWEAVVSADLAALIPARPVPSLAGRLPEWARRCASLDRPSPAPRPGL